MAHITPYALLELFEKQREQQVQLENALKINREILEFIRGFLTDHFNHFKHSEHGAPAPITSGIDADQVQDDSSFSESDDELPTDHVTVVYPSLNDILSDVQPPVGRLPDVDQPKPGYIIPNHDSLAQTPYMPGLIDDSQMYGLNGVISQKDYVNRKCRTRGIKGNFDDVESYHAYLLQHGLSQSIAL